MDTRDLQALKRARALIADPEHWTQSAFARNALGIHTSMCDPTAVRWCAAGALLKDDDGYRPHCALHNLVKGLGYPDVPTFNDTSDHATVLAAFDQLIADAEMDALEAVLSSDLVEITEEPTLVYA